MRIWATSIAIAATITAMFAVAILFSAGWLTSTSANSAERPCVPASVALTFPSSAAPEVAHAVVEQYKAYVADLGALASQLGSAQTFFLTIVSGVLAVLALNEKGRSVQELLTDVTIGVFTLVAIICGVWSITEIRFDDIFAAKFRVLCDMERSYSALLFPMYAEQSQMYRPPGAPGILLYHIGMIWVIMAAALTFVVAGIKLRRSGPKAPAGRPMHLYLMRPAQRRRWK